MFAKYTQILFTFIVLTNLIFYLHNSQKCITFALEKEKQATIAIKPKTIYEN
jgi:hypothetical protein